MSKQVPTVAARRRGTSKSRAVAGAGNVRIVGCASQRIDSTIPSAIGGERTWGHARRAGQQRRRQREEQRWSVTTDLGQPLPVTAAELDVIENHLGDLLDELLAIRPAA